MIVLHDALFYCRVGMSTFHEALVARLPFIFTLSEARFTTILLKMILPTFTGSFCIDSVPSETLLVAGQRLVLVSKQEQEAMS